MTCSVSQHIEKHHAIRIPPGGKGICPFCRSNTFSVRKDDSVGKCFHPRCGRFVTAASTRDDYRGSLYEILDRIKQACHEHLIEQGGKKTVGYAWKYLTEARLIHPDVIRDLSELGAVPKEYNVGEAFKATTQDLKARKKELDGKIAAMQVQRKKAGQRAKSEQEKGWEKGLLGIDRQLDFLKGQYEQLKERLASTAGWIAFFHTDQFHRVRSIRFRKASTEEKRFQSYIPKKESFGLFGHSLFRPYQSADKQELNRLLVVEGEFNLLQMHSLAVRTASGDAAGATYANWVASVGSATTLDCAVIAGLLESPGAVRPAVVIQDNDDAGDGMVEKLSRSLTLEVVTPPKREQDIDDFIRSFNISADALRGLEELIGGRTLRRRPYDALAKQVFETRQKQGEEDERREFEIHAEVRDIIIKDLAERGTFYHDQQRGYYFLGDEKKLIPLNDSDKQASCLMAKYGLNPAEKTHEYVMKGLYLHSLMSGQGTRAHRLAWFNKDTFAVYVFNHGNRVYRVTADDIEEVDNGTDGVLFVSDPRNEPFKLVAEENNGTDGVLFVSDPRNEPFKLVAEENNGTDGVLFVSDPRNEPFKLVAEENLGDLFDEHVTSKVNYADEERGRPTAGQQRMLMNCWFQSIFFSSLLPTRPIMAFIGPMGSGKSNSLRQTGNLLFGPNFEVKQLPDKEDSFDAVVTNSCFAAFDNADSHVGWLPDRLAVCATGGTVSRRELYTTNSLVEYPIDCFLGITSRTPHFKREDVADRLLIMRVQRIAEGQFLPEEEMKARVLKHRDRIMTSVVRSLQGTIAALKATAAKQYRTGFRMADFAVFMLRIADHSHYREKVEAIFASMQDEQASFALENDPLAVLLPKWLKDDSTNQGKPVTSWELHKELSKLAKAAEVEFGYKNSRSLGQRLGNILGSLRVILDVEVGYDTHMKQNTYSFSLKEEGEFAGKAESGGIPKTEDTRKENAGKTGV